MKDPKFLFGALIAIILLGLYAFSLGDAIQLALREVPKGATPDKLLPGVGTTLSTVGGLVSALVIAVLAISKPGEQPGQRVLANANPNVEPSATEMRVVGLISSIYVLVWILFGLAAYIVGEMLRQDAVPALTDFARAWLGLAVAAGYSYFGLKQ